MKRIILNVILLITPFVTSCDRDGGDDGEEYDWPVWILYVSAVTWGQDGGTVPVSGCPAMTWHFVGVSETETVTCYNGNHLKAWRHIDHDESVVFQVHCAGYFASDIMTANFRFADVVQLPGREGAEVIVTEQVFLRPN